MSEKTMKFEVGNIVVLVSGETVYITTVDENRKKYVGYDIEDNNQVDYITFNDSSVILKV